MKAKNIRWICLTLLAATGVVALNIEPARADPPTALLSLATTSPAIANSKNSLPCPLIPFLARLCLLLQRRPSFLLRLTMVLSELHLRQFVFTVTGEFILEHIYHNSKFDATISNFCSSPEEVTVTLLARLRTRLAIETGRSAEDLASKL